MYLQAESTGYYTAREITSIAQGLACAQNPTIIAQVLQLFGDEADFSERYNLTLPIPTFLITLLLLTLWLIS